MKKITYALQTVWRVTGFLKILVGIRSSRYLVSALLYHILETNSLLEHNFFHDGLTYHIETSPLIYSANQWTCFYVAGTCVMKELTEFHISNRNIIVLENYLEKHPIMIYSNWKFKSLIMSKLDFFFFWLFFHP